MKLTGKLFTHCAIQAEALRKSEVALIPITLALEEQRELRTCEYARQYTVYRSYTSERS